MSLPSLDAAGLGRRLSRALGALRPAPRAATTLPAATLDACADPILIVDTDDVVQHANRAVADVLGYDPEGLVGEAFAETLLLPQHRDAHRLRIRRAADGQPDAGDLPRRLPVACADGSGLEVRSTVRATRTGRRARIAIGLHEVGALASAQAALDAAEARLRTLRTVVDALPDPVVAVSRKGGVVLRNRAGARDLVAGPGGDRDAALAPEAWQKAAAVMRSGEAVHHQHEAASGGRAHLVTRVPVRDDAGAVVGAVIVSRDVTAQKAAEAQLVADKQAAEDAARANREFLATTSHEVRTLMSGVTGMLTLLQGTDLDDEQADFVGTIESSSKALLGVINDVLDLSKLEAGMVEIESRPYRVRKMVKEALAMVSQQATAKGLVLEAEVAAPVPDVVHGDEARVRQVLANLLTNAVKFTAEGSVTVRVGPGPQTAEGGPSLAFEVQDTGIGIAPDRMEAIFERFEQADASTARTHGGTGLGLAISRQLVHSMGGSLRAESSTEGSVFRFSVVLGPVARRPAPSNPQAGEPVLVARPQPAPSAPSEAASPEPASPEPASPEPSRPDRARMMTMDSVLPSARVLVVEDDDVLQRVTALTLRRLGYRPDVVGNGLEAVEAVRGSAYDVVLMDVMMPVMDGLTATREIRQDPGPHPMPAIVALTANALEEDRRKCLSAGCDAYLAKPVQPRHLASTIEKAIRDKQAAPAPA